MKDIPTPRTDAARLDEHDPYEAVATECGKLERELTAANDALKKSCDDEHRLSEEIAKLTLELGAANERIRRLEEAGDAMAVWEQGTSVEIEWRKAKEATPC
jgi:predicted  nucleic acid-binding Zn-ribbon protein